MKTILTVMATLILTTNSFADCSNLLNTKTNKYTCGDESISYDLKVSHLDAFQMAITNLKVAGYSSSEIQAGLTWATLECVGDKFVSQGETLYDINMNPKEVKIKSTIEATAGGVKITRGVNATGPVVAGAPGTVTVECKKFADQI